MKFPNQTGFLRPQSWHFYQEVNEPQMPTHFHQKGTDRAWKERFSSEKGQSLLAPKQQWVEVAEAPGEGLSDTQAHLNPCPVP